jgi:hypothetical protein
MDLRNANGGGSSGPVEVDRPWDSYADDQLGLMDHLGIDKFMVLGFCIGGHCRCPRSLHIGTKCRPGRRHTRMP